MAKVARRLFLHSEGKILGGGGGGGGGGGPPPLYESRSRSYGGVSDDSFAYAAGGPPAIYTGGRKAFIDGDFLYAVGFTKSEGQSDQSCLIVKFNKADLSIAAGKIYGGTLDGGYHERFSAVFVDGDYVYAVGYTNEDSPGDLTPLLIKFNKADLSIAAAKFYFYLGANFLDVFVDGNYIYAVGWEYYPTTTHNCLIMKINKADLSIDTSKNYYGAAGTDRFTGVFVDGDYVYAVGYTNAEGQGGYDCLIVKFYKADLSIAARKVYGTDWGDDYFYRVFVDGDYVYAVGGTPDQLMTGWQAGLIVKFNKADLSIAAAKFYSNDISSTEFLDVFVDGNYVYAVGDTDEEGQGGYDCLIVKFNKADLSIAAGKIYGGTGGDVFSGVVVDVDYIYAVGDTTSVGEGGYDCLVFRATKATIPDGSSVPAGFVCADSALTLADSTLVLDESGLTLDDWPGTAGDSALVLDDSALVLSAPYVIS